VLADQGGVIFHDSGLVEAVGPIQGQFSETPVLRMLA
jgi:hypothetical protein